LLCAVSIWVVTMCWHGPPQRLLSWELKEQLRLFIEGRSWQHLIQRKKRKRRLPSIAIFSPIHISLPPEDLWMQSSCPTKQGLTSSVPWICSSQSGRCGQPKNTVTSLFRSLRKEHRYHEQTEGYRLGHNHYPRQAQENPDLGTRRWNEDVCLESMGNSGKAGNNGDEEALAIENAANISQPTPATIIPVHKEKG